MSTTTMRRAAIYARYSTDKQDPSSVEDQIRVCKRICDERSRLAKDFEATIASAEAFLYAASVRLLTRRLARAS